MVRPIANFASLCLLAIAASVGCGGSDSGGGSPTTPPPGGGGDLSAVVGNWTADTILVSPKANPAVSREIVSEDGVTFTLAIQTSGSYVATLDAFGQSSQETGTVSVQGSTLLFNVQSPIPGNSQGTFTREADRMILLGDLVLDFNQDGTPDDLSTRFVLLQ